MRIRNLLSGVSPFAPKPTLDVGSVAPAIVAVDQNGESIDLGALYSDSLVLVYFYPKADTPGCTKQACNIRESFEEVQEAGVRVVGVSVDSPESQRDFITKHHLPFTLIADEKKEVAKAFGVPVIFGRFAARQSFLIQNGRIVWVDRHVSPRNQSQDVLEAVKNLEKLA